MKKAPMTKRALWYREFGRPAQVLAMEETRLDEAIASRLRIRMTASPINPSDLIPITGAYRHRILPPQIAGYEGVGVVIAAAGDAMNLMGRRVLALRGPGTWQSHVDCDPAWAVPVPDDIGDDIAARAYINPLAARSMLRRWPVRGRHVLLTAAGSACAGLLAQWAIDEGALSVAGIRRSPVHAAPLAALGVRPIGIEASGQIAAVAAWADVVFEAVGGPLATAILAQMRPDADFVCYGLLSGQPFAIGAHGARPQRFHLRHCLETVEPPQWQAWFRELWPALRRAALTAVAPFPLASWREALALFDAPGRRSTPMLTMA